MDGTLELPQPPQDEVTPKSNLETRQQYERATQLGSGFLTVAKERDDRRLTPFIDLTKFDRLDVAAVRGRNPNEVVTEEDVVEAKRGSFALALETATQITEVQLPRTGGVREDLESLEDMIRLIRAGSTVAGSLLKENPTIITSETKKAIARRQKITPEQVTQTDEQLIKLAEKQFQDAFTKLNTGAQFIAGYTGGR